MAAMKQSPSVTAQMAQVFSEQDDTFDLPSEYAQIINSKIKEAENKLKLPLATIPRSRLESEITSLKQEHDTWTLLDKFYRSSLAYEEDMEAGRDDFAMPGVMTERQIWDQLWRTNAEARELQIIVDWLEGIAKRDTPPVSGVDCSWPNTRAQHKRDEEETFDRPKSRKSAKPVELDPDATCRGTPIDDMDADSESRLLRELWLLTRAGQLETAQQLCNDCGQSWRAASMFGHISSTDKTLTGGSDNSALGNPTRALWVLTCEALAADQSLNAYERAVYSALSGNLSGMLGVCQTWSDCIWARAKSALARTRDLEVKKYGIAQTGIEVENNKYRNETTPPSINGIFDAAYSSESPQARSEAENPYHLLQSMVCVHDLIGLIDGLLTSWLSQKLTPELLRLAVHVALFLTRLPQWAWDRSVEQNQQNEEYRPNTDNLVKLYVHHLITERQFDSIALYTAQISFENQTDVYAHFLRRITQRSMRERMLQLAEDHQLDVHRITQRAAELTATNPPREDEKITVDIEEEEEDEMDERFEEAARSKEEELSAEDKERIGAIQWLIFDPQQRAHALMQANSLLRAFILDDKQTAAEKVLPEIPKDSVPIIKQQWAFKKRAWEANAVREYLALRTYVEAIQAYKYYEKAEREIPEPPQFPILGAGESSVKQEIAYRREMALYNNTVEAKREQAVSLSTRALKDLRAVIDYPQGWLQDEPEYVMPLTNDTLLNRDHELKMLRNKCIPHIFSLMAGLLFKGGNYVECVELADLVADETHKLYMEFTAQQLQAFLKQISKATLQMVAIGTYPPLSKHYL